jgi:hypothetical protein
LHRHFIIITWVMIRENGWRVRHQIPINLLKNCN